MQALIDSKLMYKWKIINVTPPKIGRPMCSNSQQSVWGRNSQQGKIQWDQYQQCRRCIKSGGQRAEPAGEAAPLNMASRQDKMTCELIRSKWTFHSQYGLSDCGYSGNVVTCGWILGNVYPGQLGSKEDACFVSNNIAAAVKVATVFGLFFKRKDISCLERRAAV